MTALLVLLSGLTAGVEQAMLVSSTTLLTGHVNVGGFFKITSGAAAPLVTDVPGLLRGPGSAGARARLPVLARARLGQGGLGDAPRWTSC